MINPMDLTDKRILLIGGSNALDEAIFRQIKELGALLMVLYLLLYTVILNHFNLLNLEI